MVAVAGGMHGLPSEHGLPVVVKLRFCGNRLTLSGGSEPHDGIGNTLTAQALAGIACATETKRLRHVASLQVSMSCMCLRYAAAPQGAVTLTFAQASGGFGPCSCINAAPL